MQYLVKLLITEAGDEDKEAPFEGEYSVSDYLSPLLLRLEAG